LGLNATVLEMCCKKITFTPLSLKRKFVYKPLKRFLSLMDGVLHLFHLITKYQEKTPSL